MSKLEQCKGRLYCITNLVNGKVYIGQTIQTLHKRYDMGIANTQNEHLRLSISKYGVENFEIKEVLGCLDREMLDTMEEHYISLAKSTDPKFGYNKMSGGSHPTFSQESRDKMSKTRKGMKRSKETNDKQRLTWKRLKEQNLMPVYKHTDEMRDQISLAKGCRPFQVIKKDTGEVVGVWVNRNKCAEDLGLGRSSGMSISSCLLLPKRYKSHKSYTFKEIK